MSNNTPSNTANQSVNPVTQAASLAKIPISEKEDVRRIVSAIERIMDALDELLAEECALLREGKLQEATELVDVKNQLAIQYMLLQKTIVNNAAIVRDLSPQDAEELQRRHYLFQNSLRTNLAVVATAREVASELVQNVNKDVQKAGSTNTYGQTGTLPSAPVQKRGIAVDKAF
ncbi:MAG: flagellar protein FlgN [Cohaesibacter sp.]|nr:flagellar protein FlgN [Cohaesibacter sp.]